MQRTDIILYEDKEYRMCGETNTEGRLIRILRCWAYTFTPVGNVYADRLYHFFNEEGPWTMDHLYEKALRQAALRRLISKTEADRIIHGN